MQRSDRRQAAQVCEACSDSREAVLMCGSPGEARHATLKPTGGLCTALLPHKTLLQEPERRTLVEPIPHMQNARQPVEPGG